MKRELKFTLTAMVWALLLTAAYALSTHAQTHTAANRPEAEKANAAQAVGANPPVQGSGTLGRIPKWTGLTAGTSFIALLP